MLKFVLNNEERSQMFKFTITNKLFTITNKLLKTKIAFGIAALSAGISISLIAVSAQAASIFFLSPGSQLDDDTILDIRIGPDQPLVFNIFADITGYTPSNPETTGIFLDLDEVTDEYFGAFNPNETRVVDLSGPVVQQIGQFAGVTLNPGIEPHDGIVDFGITLTEVTLFDADENVIGTDPVSSFDAPDVNERGEPGTQFNQVVELQQPIPEPSSLIGLLTLGTLGITSTFKRNLKSNNKLGRN